MSGVAARLGLPAWAPLPPTLAVGDHALRLRVLDPLGDWSVVMGCRAGAFVVEDGDGLVDEAVTLLPTPIPIDDLVVWCRDPDLLLGELVPPEDLVLDVVLAVSCLDGLVGALKEPATVDGFDRR